MFVRLKFGRYEGSVRDVRPDVAAALIASGRATDANREGEAVAIGAAVADLLASGVVPGAGECDPIVHAVARKRRS